jgi:membrane-associated phospholipid phosphatase
MADHRERRRLDDAPPAGLSDPPTPTGGAGPALRALLVVLLGATAAAVLVVGAAETGPTAADLAVLDESLDLRSGGLTAAAVAVTEIGSTVSMAVVAALVALWSLWRGRTADAVLAVGAMAGAAALFRSFKVVIDDPRPPLLTRLVEETNESLPSGHATMSIVVIGTLVVLAWAGRRAAGRAVLVAAAAAWVVAVGATRIYLGVHWFTDVVAGWLLGGAWLALCVVAWSRWRARRGGRSSEHTPAAGRASAPNI